MTTMTIETTVRTTTLGAETGRFGTWAPWVAQVLLAVVFGFAGSMKFVMSAEDMTKDIDLPIAFLRFIGTCEILGAIGMTVPGVLNIRRGLTPLAAGGLVIIMTGATVLTVAAMGVVPAAFPFGVGLGAAYVAYSRRGWLTEA